ncbi:MAG TPA: YciI family protein [Dokdonella sp.]|uniref:YciI family protein n=1 Tax=Dokdonella sp. TaxID=2291710 RepID=UPI002BAA645B|nr:YciI family protein [Dokdonella sp.]HQX64207.1 YciI family protein [Dokdonella sp.]HQY53886.1 YciI family protein [Dokdonella sp.]
MWYAITGHDNPGTAGLRSTNRAAHLARLHELHERGKLFLAGPFPAIDSEDPGPAGYTGSLIVAEFDDIAAARLWADADPYLAAGVYREVEIRPLRKVLP